jgi:hypothetical protein
VIHASLALGLKQSAGPADADFVRLFDADPSHKLDFAALGWQSQITTAGTFVGVLDLGGFRNQLQSGAVNVQVSNDTGADWALYTATVAKPIGDASGATAWIDNGGNATVSTAVGPVGAVRVGGDGDGSLAISAAGSLEVTSDYQQFANGVLNLALGGVSDYGAVQVDGLARLAGTLDVDVVDGFTPTPGDQFSLVEAVDIDGQFASVQLPASPADAVWGLTTTTSAVTLELFWSADFNKDRIVDDADLAAWRFDFGALSSTADVDTDGDADGFDFLAWQRQLGNASSSAAASAAVPEPATAVLVLMSASYFVGVRRRRHRR